MSRATDRRDYEIINAACSAYGFLEVAAEEYEHGRTESAGQLLAEGMAKWRAAWVDLEVLPTKRESA